jgi:carbon monoxide dehydrogenase subunit G
MSLQLASALHGRPQETPGVEEAGDARYLAADRCGPLQRRLSHKRISPVREAPARAGGGHTVIEAIAFMKFDNEFELPLPPGKAWAYLLDVPRIAPCMPGAELTEVESERSFKGKVSVRLGPVALSFSGRAVIEDIDNDNHAARIKAQGLDAKGRGGASAMVDFKVEPAAGGSRIVIATDLTLSGSVAQYGRGAGVIREVASQLTAQFARSLSQQYAADVPAAPQAAAQNLPASQAAQPTAAAPPQKPAAISGFSLLFSTVWSLLRNALGLGKRAADRGDAGKVER